LTCPQIAGFQLSTEARKGRDHPSSLDTPGVHQALVHRKYRRLFSSMLYASKPQPKGPDEPLI
jgi:hypothetical protein